MKRIIQALIAVLLLTSAASVLATPITRYERYTGNYNYVATGGSLRNSSTDGCTLNATSSQALSGIPVGATVTAAYLYWGGSGSTLDSSVILNGNTVNAARTFTTTFTNGTTIYPYFGGFANVTSLIAADGTLIFGGLTVDNGEPFCSVSAVVSGWSLIVIYQSSSEPLRAINIFDGLDYFRGSSVLQTPDGFRIPSTGIDGKMTVVTWEGDPGNSNPLNGFSESLTFNGVTLDDGMVPAGSSPTVQQYDGTINALGLNTTYGVDVDTYDVSSYLSAGQTSATTNYSAGGDLVLLTAQVVSVTSEPQIDLSITKTHSGNFTVGSNASYTLSVANAAGVQAVDYLTTVSDTLPAGLTYVSAIGTGWSCGAVAQVVTCTHPAPLTSGSAFADITLTVAVANAAYPSVSNTATVSSIGSSDDNVTINNIATDVATVLGSNLSTSTKTVVDLNGGDANPGDTLRYTITLANTTSVSATAVSVTDDMPANTSGFIVLSLPSGANNNSTGIGTGANNSGYLNITNITVPANGSVTVVFDVIVATGVSPGATINNTATVTNPGGVAANPVAPQIIVSASQIPGSGTKQLYLINGQGLTRTRPGAQTTVTIDEGASITWTLTQPLQQDVTLSSGNFPIQLWLTEANNGNNRIVTVTLNNSAIGTIASVGPTNYALSGTPTQTTIVLNTTSTITAPAGSTFSLTITNSSTGNGNRQVLVHQLGGANASRIDLNSASIINVDNVLFYNAAYNGGVATSTVTRGSTAYIRAVVSDPFGSFDISSATVTLSDPAGTAVVTNAAMTQVDDSGLALKTYEYAYAVPANAAAGAWTASVTANEGVEGISDLGVAAFTVVIPMPLLQLGKVSSVVWDPVNLFINPKRIPGSIVSYTVTVTNSGPGAVDASSLVITDIIPAGTSLCVSSVAQCTVVQFTDGTPVSGLNYNSSNTTYSSAAGGVSPFTYTPVANSDGVDAAVTAVRIAPTNAMVGNSGGGDPNFSITFRVKVK
jgi:uncharacterized repeat protein (TIGR01451 family)